MRWLKKIYMRSEWYPVYNTRTENARARTALLMSALVFPVYTGFSSGIFYTGLLMGYGINIVNISIVTFIPTIASLASLFSPFVLERFQKRRTIVTVTRMIVHLLNIIGITLLPQLVQDETSRVIGLIAIVFVANVISHLFTPGYSSWHMPYITPDVRSVYFASTTLVSNASSGLVLILFSLITDSLPADAQLNLIVTMRYVSFAFALLDCYFLQKPKEPNYAVTASRPALGDIFRLPFSNKRFLLTMVIYGIYAYIANIAASVSNAWLLDEVRLSYSYVNIINALYSLAILFTSRFWGKIVKKNGTFKTMAIGLLLHLPTYIAYGFVSHDNYIWLMTLVRLTQHALGMSLLLSTNNLIYVNLPPADQTNYIAFHSLVGNLAIFFGMMTGTWVVAAFGSNVWTLFGHTLSSVPTLLMAQGILFALLAVLIMAIRKKVEPD